MGQGKQDFFLISFSPPSGAADLLQSIFNNHQNP